jgi:molecular chaperone IbpA
MSSLSTVTMNDALTRLQKQIIGSDKFFSLPFDNAGFPAYNIEKVAEDQYKLTLALAGWHRENLFVEVEDGRLIVKGQKTEDGKVKTFLHQGIAERDFYREFKLLDNTYVTGCEFNDGILTVNILREIPEKLKPRRIEIS